MTPGHAGVAVEPAASRPVLGSAPMSEAEEEETRRLRARVGTTLHGKWRLDALIGAGGMAAVYAATHHVGHRVAIKILHPEGAVSRELRARFGIAFHRLLTLANMPIRRFAHALAREGRLAAYQALLVNHFNPETLPGLMCRELLSVGHDGRLFDCDFNQALALPLPGPERTIWDLGDLSALAGRPVATAPHCFGCSAGAGSSCGGALV